MPLFGPIPHSYFQTAQLHFPSLHCSLDSAECDIFRHVGFIQIWMVVDGPRSGFSQERSTHTIFLSGVNSTACTGGLVLSNLPLHSLNQLFTSVLPFGKRHAICRLFILNSGESTDRVIVATCCANPFPGNSWPCPKNFPRSGIPLAPTRIVFHPNAGLDALRGTSWSLSKLDVPRPVPRGYLSEHVKNAALERHSEGLKKYARFWLREVPYGSRWTGDEGLGIPTELMGMVVPIERWVAGASPQTLARSTRSSPIWLGDCHWLEALIHAIEASGKT